MSKQLSELCALLVRHEHGDLPHLLFSTLLEHGRLQFGHLVRFTGLSPRYVKNGLAVLITHTLITFHPPGPAQDTYYEAHQLQAYNLVRSGHNAELLQQRYGKLALSILTSSQVLGLASPSQLAEEAESQARNNLTNGDSQHASNNLEGRRAPVTQLQREGFLEELRDITFMSETDMDLAVGEWIRGHDPYFMAGVSGPKKSKEFRDAIDEKKLKLKRGLESLNDPDDDQSHTGQEEAPHAQESPRKKRKTNKKSSVVTETDDEQITKGTKKRKSPPVNGATVAGAGTETKTLEAAQPKKAVPLEINEPALYVNHHRFNLAFRSQTLARYATRRLGQTAGQVYQALLQVLEEETVGKLDAMGDDEDAYKLIVADVSQVMDALDPTHSATLHREVEARDEWETREEDDVKIKKPPINGVHKHKHKTDIEKRETVKQAVLMQLHILADDPHEFVHYDKNFKQWSVDHKRLAQTLVQFELERTINARFGPTATRMIRILHDKGKLEEKQISQYGLVQQKELRTVLASMQEAGYIDVQEVPRDNSRQPSRNIYLWAYDQDRTRSVLLEWVYKSMSRLIQRHEAEKQNVSSVLEKAQRTDVQGHEDEFLSIPEKEALSTWESKEEKLLIQLSRLDEMVLLFRDCVEPTSS